VSRPPRLEAAAHCGPPVAVLDASEVLALAAEVDDAVSRFALDEALTAIFRVGRRHEPLPHQQAPWTLTASGQAARARTVPRTALEALAAIAAEIGPFLPTTAVALNARLGKGLVTKQHSARPFGRNTPRLDLAIAGNRNSLRASAFAAFADNATPPEVAQTRTAGGPERRHESADIRLAGA
jgi:hypothetical protein